MMKVHRHDYDVIVVGAGCAGLYAAKSLQTLGLSVRVLEAQDRFGGRLMQDSSFGPFTVDLGGEFVHGEIGTVYDMFEENSWPLADVYSFSDTSASEGAFFKGKVVDWVDSNPLISDMRDAIDFASSVQPKDDISLHDFFVGCGLQKDRNLFMLTENIVARDWANDLVNMGLREYAREELSWPYGERNFRPDQSFGVLIKHLAKDVDVLTSCPVEIVDYRNAKRVVVHCSQSGEKKAFSSRFVIITVPIPILRDGDLRMLPALPKVRRDALDSIGYGPAMKIVCKFTAEFWTDRPHAVVITDHPLIAQYWFTGPSTRVNKHVVPDKDGAICVVTAFITGSQVHMVNEIGVENAVTEFLALLDTAYAVNSTRKKPSDLYVGCISYDWTKNPFIKGGYSSPGLGAAGARVTVSEPLGNCVFFAGEGFNTVSSASVHAAVQSASRAVSEICLRLCRRMPGFL
eukprot:ANDGO_06956.mRNA.1 Protein FLOWERING LOCUS D